MDILSRSIRHITEVANIPSFSSYEERLHPYVNEVLKRVPNATRIETPGNNILCKIDGQSSSTIALTAHLDKINHFGREYPSPLPVEITPSHIEGAMDDSVGVGVLLTLAELTEHKPLPNILIFFSEMEESKGLKEHPELLKNDGEGYETGMGAKRIARTCLDNDLIPDEVITVDTTPLFKGKPGIALYSKHWELNELDPSQELIKKTNQIEQEFTSINSKIKLENNTNDYLHYGQLFNESGTHIVPSVALEPSIYPYHQQGERVFINDVKHLFDILMAHLVNNAS